MTAEVCLGLCRFATGMLTSTDLLTFCVFVEGSMMQPVNPAWGVFLLPHSAGHEWGNADHWMASCGGLRRQLVWKGEVSRRLQSR